jgi:hypothetical protein
VRHTSFVGVIVAALAIGGCAPRHAAKAIPMAAFPAPDGLEGMRPRIPVDLEYAANFARFLGRSGIAVREVAHVRAGDFFAYSPRAVRMVTALGDAEVMFLSSDATYTHRDAGAIANSLTSREAPPILADTTPPPPRQLYFVARRDIFVVTGSVLLYDAIQRAMRADPIADS